MGGPEVFGYVVLSDSTSCANTLAPNVMPPNLLTLGLGSIQWEMEVGATPDAMQVVHVEDSSTPSLFTGMGLRGPACGA